MLKKYTWVLLSLLLVLGLIIGGFGCAAPTPTPTPTSSPTPIPTPTPTTAWKPTSLVNFSTTSVSGASYISGQAWGGVVTKQTGVFIKFQPTTTTTERAQLLRTKATEFGYWDMYSVYSQSSGIEEANQDGWGPQKYRMLWLTGATPYLYAVRADSGIKTAADLKGKKLTRYPTYPVGDAYMKAFLAFFQMKDTDYTAVPVSSSTAGYSAFLEGAADMTWVTQTASAAQEFVSSPHGARAIELPPNDAAGWERFRQVLPFAYPYRPTSGPAAPFDTWACDSAIIAYDWQDENLVYWVTKQKTELYSAYKDAYPALVTWTLQVAINTAGSPIPFHPGAIRYYKEIGSWTAELDAWQTKQLATEQKRISDWQAAHPTWKWDSAGK